MSYLSTAPLTQNVQLKVQLIEAALGDEIVSTSGNNVTIDCGQPVSVVREALFTDDSAGTVAPVVHSNQTVSGNTVTLALGVAFAANDSVQLYVEILSPSQSNATDNNRS